MRKDFVDKLLEHDVFVRIMAVVLALVLWFGVAAGDRSDGQVQRVINGVSITLRNVAPNLEVTEVVPSTLAITVQADPDQVGHLQPSEFTASLDLAGTTLPGRRRYQVEGVKIPPGVTLVGFNPEQVEVTVEALQEVSQPVRVQADGQPAQGYEVVRLAATPDVVVLRGVNDRLQAVQRVVAHVDVSAAERDVSETAAVMALGEDGRPVDGVRVTPEQVRVTASIERSKVTSRVPLKPAVVGEPAPGYDITKVELSENTAIVRATPERLQGVEQVATEPVDVSGATSDIVREVAVSAPPGVEVVSPRRVTLTIRIEAHQ